METKKRERFIRIAESRTNKVIDDLRLLGNCSNKLNYDYDEEDVRKIFQAIDKQMKNIRSKFSGEAPAEDKFSLI